MNIVLGNQLISDLDKKYTLLRLDTFLFSGQDQPVTAYCVLENIPIVDLAKNQEFCDLHENLIKNYELQNWNFCEQALEHLIGRWNGEIDSFYVDLANRIYENKKNDVDSNWSPIIKK